MYFSNLKTSARKLEREVIIKIVRARKLERQVIITIARARKLERQGIFTCSKVGTTTTASRCTGVSLWLPGASDLWVSPCRRVACCVGSLAARVSGILTMVRGNQRAEINLPDYGNMGDAFSASEVLPRKAGAVPGAALCAWLAEHLMGLGKDDYRFMDHAGNGFCWGSSMLSAFMPGMVADNATASAPFASLLELAGCGHDRKVEALVRDAVWSELPKLFKPTLRNPFPPKHSISAWVELEAMAPAPNQLQHVMQVRSCFAAWL